MRQRDVRHMRVVTLSAQTCGNRMLQWHASHLSMGMRRENAQQKQQQNKTGTKFKQIIQSALYKNEQRSV